MDHGDSPPKGSLGKERNTTVHTPSHSSREHRQVRHTMDMQWELGCAPRALHVGVDKKWWLEGGPQKLGMWSGGLFLP